MVANYVVVSDANITLSRAGTRSRQYQEIHTPGVQGRFAILLFQVNPDGETTVQIKVNETVVFELEFFVGPRRSMHEVFKTDWLKEQDNEITVAVIAGSGVVIISDIVILYQAEAFLS